MFVNVVFSTAACLILVTASKSNCVRCAAFLQKGIKHYKLNDIVIFKYLTIDSLYDFNIEYCHLDLILDLVLVQTN